LKVKQNPSSTIETKIDVLERILQIECIEKTIINPNHENERTRINLKWTVLSECALCYRQIGSYEKAIEYFEKVSNNHSCYFFLSTHEQCVV
jgi:tetratricopeptide (TPR) repeat protein